MQAHGKASSTKEPTDAVVRVVLACVCASDLWYYRGTRHQREPPFLSFLMMLEKATSILLDVFLTSRLTWMASRKPTLLWTNAVRSASLVQTGTVSPGQS
jgi:hypothetical protein